MSVDRPQNMGASASAETGSCPTGQAPSGLDALRYDPARKYARDTGYGKSPQWGRLYGKFFPKNTCGASRHCRIIAEEILRNPRSPVRRLLIDAGYEPDHWASSLEATIVSLWETRARLWEVDPVGQQKRSDRLTAQAIKRSAIAMARDSAETACPAPVPQDCQARAESIAQGNDA